jgi:hypothetical protein
MVDHIGRITRFHVKKAARTATIKLDISPFPSPFPKFKTFKLNKDNDSSFEAMASICASKVNSGQLVIVRVLAGAADEIDELEVL